MLLLLLCPALLCFVTGIGVGVSYYCGSAAVIFACLLRCFCVACCDVVLRMLLSYLLKFRATNR